MPTNSFRRPGCSAPRFAPDHKHHHGLMFALSVDGVNFWEEAGAEHWRKRKSLR